MNAHRIRIVLAALPFAATVLVGCHGSSPTDIDSPTLAAAPSQALAPSAKHGGDDGADDNGGGAEPGDDHNQGSGGGHDDATPNPTPTPRPDNRGPGRQDRPRGTVEVEGRVTAVSAGSITIGTKVVLVNSSTTFSRRGDLTSLDRTSAALAANKRVRAEARAIRQADGSLLAQTIKIEVD